MPNKAKHIIDLTIENFRGLRKVELRGLGAVNLIVGRNNTGKTSLLEAILAAADPSVIRSFPAPFRQLPFPNSMSPDEWLLSDGASCGVVEAKASGRFPGAILWKGAFPREGLGFNSGPAVSFSVGTVSIHELQLSGHKLRVRTVPVRPPSHEEIVKPFADAVRSPQSERDMEAILTSVDPRIRSVRLDHDGRQPFISVDVGLSERVPFSHAGQGVYRIVSMLSELLGQRPDICLIDELENGVHHTVLPQLWKGIAEISSRLGVQVFVTTHSRECLEAATRVFVDEDPANTRDFALIQLMRVRGEVVGRVLNEQRVAEALDNDIELR